MLAVELLSYCAFSRTLTCEWPVVVSFEYHLVDRQSLSWRYTFYLNYPSQSSDLNKTTSPCNPKHLNFLKYEKTSFLHTKDFL